MNRWGLLRSKAGAEVRLHRWFKFLIQLVVRFESQVVKSQRAWSCEPLGPIGQINFEKNPRFKRNTCK